MPPSARALRMKWTRQRCTNVTVWITRGSPVRTRQIPGLAVGNTPNGEVVLEVDDFPASTDGGRRFMLSGPEPG